MKEKILLHVCCAPDATVPWEDLINEGYNVTGFFYGNNIHPLDEYKRRKDAFIKLAEHLDSDYVINSYEPEQWLELTRRTSTEPEGGARCSICFSAQLLAAARCAALNRHRIMTTTLTISPHKDPDHINTIGKAAASSYGIEWLPRIWRKDNGFVRSVAKSRELELYRQNYCGCIYSIRRG